MLDNTLTMKLEKHITELIKILEDIEKELSVPLLGFAYSEAVVHMFCIAFHQHVDPSTNVKHGDARSKDRLEWLKRLTPDFEGKDTLFELWRGMELLRNELCYCAPNEAKVKEYAERFFKIKRMLEKHHGRPFTVTELRGELK